MDELEALRNRVAKLEKKSSRFSAAVVLMFLLAVTWFALSKTLSQMQTPSVRWLDGQIHIFTYDGTCTFTHVAAYTSDGRIYAALDPPLVRFESGNFDISPQTLRWYDEKEQKVKPP